MVTELQRPRLFPVLATVVALGLIGIVAAGLWQWSEFAVRAELERKVLTRPSPALLGLRADEDRRLHRYQWLDARHEALRIPVERALELVLAERGAP
jgi:hypothetical protein